MVDREGIRCMRSTEQGPIVIIDIPQVVCFMADVGQEGMQGTIPADSWLMLIV